ncbi:putative dNA replication factor Y [Mycobacterium intracellulare MIN_061107_1834]|nr:putative dNA replication factor Y [Mycobacterium intracellulare MIN_061107_1834]
MLSVPHLDREFDYLVSAEQSDDAQPGVRVRVRFHGRLVDGFVLERRADTDHRASWAGWTASCRPNRCSPPRSAGWSTRWPRATRHPSRRLAAGRAGPHARVEREPS